MERPTTNPDKLPFIDVEKGYFDTDKRRYYVEPDEMSTARYQQYKILSIEVILDKTIEDVINAFNEINKVSTGRTNHKTDLERHTHNANITYNMNYELVNYGSSRKNWDKLLRLCALFCNYEGEDKRKIDEAVIASKIEDWVEHGFNHYSFFLLCAKGLPMLAEKFQFIAENGTIEAMPMKTI